MLPGIPLIFGGIWLAAAVDRYQHVGSGWLIGIGIIAAVGLSLDLTAAALGARRVGASTQAVSGALIVLVLKVDVDAIRQPAPGRGIDEQQHPGPKSAERWTRR